MTKTDVFIDRLRGISKTYFSYPDLKKFYPGKEDNLPVVINRLLKRGRLFRIIKGYYTLNFSSMDWESLACERLKPSYISLESALWRYGLMNEIPARITLITTKKSRTHILKDNIFEYSHLNPKLFFGYKIEKNILMAEKEKAFLDEIYLISLKKRSLNIKRLNMASLDKRRIIKWKRHYPNFTQKFLDKVLYS